MRGPGQYNTNSNILFLCMYSMFVKFLINTREKQELPGVEPGTSDLQAFGCPTEPYTPDNQLIRSIIIVIIIIKVK